jgi:hypothetical protein
MGGSHEGQGVARPPLAIEIDGKEAAGVVE